MHRAPSEWVVEKQHAGHHVALHHRAGDAAVRDEVLDGLLFAFSCHILDDLQAFVGYLGKEVVVICGRVIEGD